MRGPHRDPLAARSRIVMAAAGVMLLAITGCKVKDADNPPVARVGEREISHQYFLEEFTFHPQFRNNSTMREARMQQLNFLQEQALLALAAEQEKLDTLRIVRDRLQYIENNESLKELYRREILDNIQISDEEAWEEYKRSNLQVKLRHLFAPTLEEARRYRDRLNHQESFEQLAAEVFTDSTLARHGGELGFVGITDLDPLLADSVYHLRIGQISNPLRSTFGYHIMQVEDVKQSVFLSREEFEQNKAAYVNSVKQRRAYLQSREYLARVLRGRSVTVHPQVLGELLGLNKTHIQLRRQELPMLTIAVTDGELQLISEQAANLNDEVLVEFTGGRWTVGQFLKKLRQMPPLQRPVINERSQLVRHIVDMVRDQLLIEEARRKGIQDSKTVRAEVQNWRTKLLAGEFQKRLLIADFKKRDPSLWQRRRSRFDSLKTAVPVVVDTTMLFKGISPTQMQQRIPRIETLIRENYQW